MLNSDGYMLVEIILASVIVISVVYYLLNLTYKFKDKNEDIYYSTELTSLKNNITKNIMNDLDDRLVVNYDVSDDKTNVTFKIKEGDNVLYKRISINNNEIEYGTWSESLNKFEKDDNSYYRKDIDGSIEMGKPKITFGNNMLTINIPIKNIYDKNSYDVILNLQYRRPLTIHYCLNGGKIEEGADKNSVSDEIIEFGESGHYLTPNNHESIDNILLIRNDGEYFSGWYVTAKGSDDKNVIFWNGCSEISNSERCWSSGSGHGWYSIDALNGHSYFLGDYYNHSVGYDFAEEKKAINVDLIDVYELWLYACYTDIDTTVGADSNSKYGFSYKNQAAIACNNKINEIDTSKCDNPNWYY